MGSCQNWDWPVQLPWLMDKPGASCAFGNVVGTGGDVCSGRGREEQIGQLKQQRFFVFCMLSTGEDQLTSGSRSWINPKCEMKVLRTCVLFLQGLGCPVPLRLHALKKIQELCSWTLMGNSLPRQLKYFTIFIPFVTCFSVSHVPQSWVCYSLGAHRSPFPVKTAVHKRPRQAFLLGAATISKALPRTALSWLLRKFPVTEVAGRDSCEKKETVLDLDVASTSVQPEQCCSAQQLGSFHRAAFC